MGWGARVALAVWFAVAPVEPSWAAPKSAQPSVGRGRAALLKRAARLCTGTDPVSDLAELEAAHRGTGAWELLFELGRCQRRLEKFTEAVKSFEAYLAQGADAVPATGRSAAERALADLKRSNALVTVTVAGPPADVTIDGESVGRSPFREPFLLAPGRKTFWANREGHQPAKRTETLAAGTQVSIELAHLALAAQAPAPPAPATAPPESRQPPAAGPDDSGAEPEAPAPRSRFPVAGVVVSGLGALALGGGIALGALAQGQSDQVNTLFTRGGRWDGYYDARQAEGERLQTWAAVAGIGGAVVLTTGLIITLASLGSEPPEGEVDVSTDAAAQGPVEDVQPLLGPLRGGGWYGGVACRF